MQSWIGNGFLKIHKYIKNDNLYFIKFKKKFVLQKTLLRKQKRQATEWQKILTTHTHIYNELVSEIGKVTLIPH